MKPKRGRRNGSRKRPKEAWERDVRAEVEAIDTEAEISRPTKEDERLESELNRLIRDVSGS